MATPLFLLDTNILLALIRASTLGQYLDATYQLRSPLAYPLICIVSHGEIGSLAARNGWGPHKRATLDVMLKSLVTVDISRQEVIDAYVALDLASLAHPGGARPMGKNDLWIAAASRAAGATLLTTDKDFDHLHPDFLRVEYVDPTSRL